MNLTRYFLKPRWQSKDAGVRRAAVTSDDAADLLAALARIAREDVDAGVRIAALRRLADPGLAQALAQDDRDEGVRRNAHALWLDLLTGTHAQAPTLTERTRLLRAQDDARLIEHVAVHAPEAELRTAALQRVARTALIAERAIADADAGVRGAALARIDDEPQLLRIAERARRTDKRISRMAGERLTALRMARGDASTIAAEARSLCERLERSLRAGDDADTIARIESEWAAVAALAGDELGARFTTAKALLVRSRNPAPADAEPATVPVDAAAAAESSAAEASVGETCEEPSAQVEPEAAMTAPSAPTIDETVARLRVDAQLDQVRIENEREREQQQTRIAEFADLLQQIGAAIDGGRTAQAHEIWPRVIELRTQLGAALPAELRRRFAGIEEPYTRLTRWQRWSDNHRRRQLCEEIDALATSGLHPDAIATRVREAQAEWRRLDEIEGPQASTGDGLARRFRNACRHAIEPTRTYFSKRDELRKTHAGTIDALIQRTQALLAESADARTIQPLRRDVAQALRMLDQVDPRERKALAGKLKDTLGALDAYIGAHHAEVEGRKAALIAQAEALAASTDTRAAIAQARELQKHWQASGSGRRAREEAQWRVFRTAIDAVFAHADGERAARTARDREALDNAAALCAQLEALASADTVPDRGAIARVDAAWRALGCNDRALRDRYDQAHSTLRDAHSRHERTRRRARFDIWMAHHELCRQLERGEIPHEHARVAQAGLPALDIARTDMHARMQSLLADETIRPADAMAQADCLIELEQLAGVESAQTDRQRRLDLQVAQLAARMRGDSAAAPSAALEALLVRWTRLGVPGEHATLVDARFRNAFERVVETL